MRIDFHKQELRCRVVVFGSYAVGKTTFLCQLAREAGPEAEPLRQTALDHSTSFLRFSDLLDVAPLRGGLRPRFELVTVPGTEPYPAAWRLLIQEADGVLFMADSITWRLPEACQSLHVLRRLLHDQGRALRQTPLVFAYNKQDLPGALAPSSLDRALNEHGRPSLSLSACTGRGVREAADLLSQQVLEKLAPDLPRAVA